MAAQVDPPVLSAPARAVAPTRLHGAHLAVAGAFLALACIASMLIGPADLPPGAVIAEVLSKVPLLHVHAHLDRLDASIVWQFRAPRVVLGGIVGTVLACSGAAYQGVFQNPLADPYLLGVAAGAGLGATAAIVATAGRSGLGFDPVPIAAFAGAVAAVAVTYLLGRAGRAGHTTTSLILAGVAIGSFLTAAQTYLQQRSSATLNAVYSWILGGISGATWSQVTTILPYVGVALVVLIGCRQLLDVMSLGDEEAESLGVHAGRVRAVTIGAATLATAAVVSVSGLIGFVGIIVPHTIRLLVGPSYRQIIPLSALAGAGFLVLADLLARTILSPAEVPLGVVTAFAGAPFFLVILRRGRAGA